MNVDPVTGEILSLPAEGPVTGEVLTQDEYPSFASLDDAEDALYGLMEQGESLRVSQMRVLDAIREQQLYTERANPKTGEPFGSMEEYIPYLIKSTVAFGTTAPRTIKNWLTCWRVYHGQLGYDPDTLVQNISHAEVLLPAAARSTKTLALSPEDEPLDTGGKKLGRPQFERLVEEIFQKVQDQIANPGVDELKWPVSETRKRVQEILGRTEEKVNYEFTAHFRGDKVVLDGFSVWVGVDDDAQNYQIGDAIPRHVFERIVGSHKVVGLGEGWRDS